MLQVHDLKVALDAEAGLVKAIDGLRLTIARGETFALVGESGCGKSMTALALMRLLPDNGRVTEGSLHVEGEDVFALPESRMRSVRGGKIGMIFQEPSTSLNPVKRVGEQIVEAIEAHTELRGPAARAKAIEWLGKVGIPEPERRIDEYPFRLSGGQKQRVMIAMTLAAEPDFLIADEPTTALDVTIQAQILDLLKRLQSEQGMGLLLITHDLAVVAGMAHRVALMYAGQIIEEATSDEFFRAPKHPYAKLLLRALPDADKRGGRLAAIPGTVPPLWQEFTGCRFAPRCDRVMPECHTTIPELIDLGARRNVRCILYRDGAMPLDAAPIQGEPVAALPEKRTETGLDQPLLLDVKQLAVRFPIRRGLLQRAHGHFNAVDGISFAIRPGETLALVGESGCGKTTTGKAIVQLLRHQAVIEGQAVFQGHDLFTLQGDALRDARRAVQIIFQDPFASLNPRMRVFDVLEEGLLALRPELDPSARRALLEKLVDQVGLRRDALQRYPHEFSGGQRQRIAIARALAVNPKLIVCDEPTSALDVSVQAQILNLLRELQRELGVSYLFITHNIGVVEYIADHVAVMQKGRIEEAGTTESVLSSPQSSYTRTLLAAVPRIRAELSA
ncbi:MULTISPECIES: dipeptide ABC transporter ATP-binding protein [unclassified Rhizobacter]|uniref:ABC transporter ATP-binding protein n=1 Tax=unclassified Rhizobacter TaxID=2640088 RepID=UPI00070235BD|nr:MULTISPECIES: dipeptide ABC transporter ATP-binding protein [unclassified Rhizobacter]KQU81121.1 ABC transporter ATP-binding protein [Rhizobacter sp. Root29]KQW04665.1 ABC transporter ATP-binding protein [Rhizobacter sp. Root1238]KRB06504.1 ABC transporter ATP-binding protein [Rhizobacter sp. Root16D2]